MTDAALFDAPPPQREAALSWRKPAGLWVALSALIGLGAPYIVLVGEGGVGHIVALAAMVGFASALVSLVLAGSMGHAVRSRREIVLHVLWLVTLAAIVAPVASQMVITAIAGGGNVNPLLSIALWPLSIMLGWPYALFAGLTLSILAFTRSKPTLLLQAETEPSPSAF